MAHHRQQFLSEFRSEGRHALAGLLDACLCRVVLDIVHLRHLGSTVKSLLRLLLLPLHHVDIVCQRRHHL